MKRFLSIGAALLVGVLGTVFVAAYANSADKRALAGQEAVQVYVVSKPVPAGTTAKKAVEDKLITKELIAKKAVPVDALVDVNGTYGQLVATTALQPGTVVLAPVFASKTSDGVLGIPEGKLAVSVALDDPSRVGSFVTVGSHVAVYDTFNKLESDKTGSTPAGDKLAERHEFTRATRLVLPDVEVLALGAQTGTAKKEDNGDQQQEVDQTSQVLVTLAVTQAEAERIIHVSRTGTMTFALLGPSAAVQYSGGVNDRNMFGVTR